MLPDHRALLILALPVFLLALLAGAVLSESGDASGEIFFTVAASSSYEGKPRTRVDVLYNVPYEGLNFLKTEEGYKATVDFSVVFYGVSGEQVGGDVWRRDVVADTYEETKMATKRFASFVEFRIPPGEYSLKARIEDLSSGRAGVVERDIIVRAFGSGELELSDPIFLHFVSDTLSFPNPSREYVLGARGAVTFSAYRNTAQDTLSLSTSVEDSKGKVWTSGTVLLEGLREERKTIVFSMDTFPQDTFSFAVRLEDSLLAIWPFVVYRPFFMNKEKYLERIESMRYIASDAELKKLKSASPEEREKTYHAFWVGKDPVPSTERNEAEEEYFSRVEYSNRHFGGIQQGWKSDRGRIYIQYGRPDEVEKHPFEIDRYPYEVWYYYASGHRFVFVDQHNLGRYELLWWKER
jgi:GWxTD domain-containing protein